MYTLSTMKFSDRWRRLFWRLQTRTYTVWVTSTVVTLALAKSYVVAAGSTDTCESRNGSPEAAPRSITLLACWSCRRNL
jgi:hypothetical protein